MAILGRNVPYINGEGGRSVAGQLSGTEELNCDSKPTKRGNQMPDRSHVKTSIPCKTPGCSGFLRCDGGSRVVAFVGKIVRRRQRECEVCGRTVQTVEYEFRLLKAGRKGFFSTPDQ